MYIKGIGTIRKEDAMKFLTKEGRDAVKSGEATGIASSTDMQSVHCM